MTTREKIIEQKVNDTNDEKKESIQQLHEPITKKKKTFLQEADDKPFLSLEQMKTNMYNIHVNALTDDFSLFADDPNIGQMFPYKIKYKGEWVATKFLNRLVWHPPLDEYDYALVDMILHYKKYECDPQAILSLTSVCTDEERMKRFLKKVKKEISEEGGGFDWISFRDCTDKAYHKKRVKKLNKEFEEKQKG